MVISNLNKGRLRSGIYVKVTFSIIVEPQGNDNAEEYVMYLLYVSGSNILKFTVIYEYN